MLTKWWNCSKEMRSFLFCKSNQGGQKKLKKATPDVVSNKQPKTSLEFGLPSF